jgi:hypothetical protein
MRQSPIEKPQTDLENTQVTPFCTIHPVAQSILDHSATQVNQPVYNQATAKVRRDKRA